MGIVLCARGSVTTYTAFDYSYTLGTIPVRVALRIYHDHPVQPLIFRFHAHLFNTTILYFSIHQIKSTRVLDAISKHIVMDTKNGKKTKKYIAKMTQYSLLRQL
ncbi:hypothetical protein Hanom_Chr11g00992391 [Helianthus anomalus]